MVDPLAEKAYHLTPFRYGFNNPIRIIDPDGRIEVDPITAKKYPGLVSYVKNLKTEWGNKSKEFKDAFMKTSGLNLKQVNSMLTYGKGPKLMVEDLDTKVSQTNGVTVYFKDGKTGEASNAKGGKGLIKLDDDVVGMYENAKNMGEKEAGKLMVESTLFHEGTHFGNVKVNKNSNGKYVESGKEFENLAYGKDIGRTNVSSSTKTLPEIPLRGVGGAL